MRIYLVATTALSGGMDAFLADRHLDWRRTDSASDAEKTVEAAGRVCYMSFGERQFRQSNREYVDNLVKQGHESVLEHATFTLLIDRVSRALTHQIVRHRIGFAYSQLSQQYYDEADAEFMEPPLLDGNHGLRKQWEALIEQSRAMYCAMRDAFATPDSSTGLSKKELQRMLRASARLALPNATLSTIVVTGNARAWRHLLRVRGEVFGDLEMREYCVEVFKKLSESAPNLFADFVLATDPLGQYVKHAPEWERSST